MCCVLRNGGRKAVREEVDEITLKETGVEIFSEDASEWDFAFPAPHPIAQHTTPSHAPGAAPDSVAQSRIVALIS